ncbi:MAG: aminotransferase class I/II-fold pyridoxal phosphate-dependent enzyme, partial [Planctomycetes bacterium]|nr:aminotransferase class I/II-fold pyridoxal phosphate-dependent enzyme [Planctomycetota bacterium]
MSRGTRMAGHMAAQERFEGILASAFRAFGHRLSDLSYANAYDGPDEPVLSAIAAALTDRSGLAYQYTPYGGNTATRRLIGSQLARNTGQPFNYKDVILTPGAMAALNLVFRALVQGEEGEGECLVLTPCWLDYPVYLENLGVPFRFVPMAGDKHLDLDALARALQPSTRAVILSSPGCPSGVLFGREELESLAATLDAAESRFGTRILLIGDEVHRDLLWSGEPFTSVLSCRPRSVSIYSFGKALFLQGQRIGYVAVNPAMPEREEVRAELQRAVRYMGFCTPTNLMQRAVPALLDYRPRLELVAARQHRTRAALQEFGYEVCEGKATFFVYARSPDPDEFLFVERLAQKGLMVLPSSVFHEPGWFRISPDGHGRGARSRPADPRGGPRMSRLETRLPIPDLCWRGSEFLPPLEVDDPGAVRTHEGQFARAVTDGERVLLARDRYGIHKLFFAIREGGTVVAAHYLADLLDQGAPFAAIASVPSGHTVEIDPGAGTSLHAPLSPAARR